MSILYSKEQKNWILANAGEYTDYANIAQDFNAVFKTTKSINAIQQQMSKVLNVHLETEKTKTHYAPEQERWLIENYSEHESYYDMTNEFNAKFSTNRKREAIREQCTKRLKLNGMDNPTRYKKGNIKAQCPIGTIRKTPTGSYIKVMDSQFTHQTGYAEPYWLPIQKKVWIDHYSEVPENKMVIFLDCNRENLDIKNLYCIDRKISALIACNGWYSSNPEVTLTAIKWCELHYAIAERRKGEDKC